MGHRLKCNKCESKKSVSTNALRKHVKNFHPETKSKITDYYEKRDKQNKKDLRECLMRFVVMERHAFSIIEEPDFIILLKCLSPDIGISSGKTIERDIFENFNEKKSKLIQMFSEFNFKIAITTDIWTSIANRPYLAITAHFVNVKRNLKQVLIELCYIPHPHGGEQVKNALIKTLNEYNILDKVITITF